MKLVSAAEFEAGGVETCRSGDSSVLPLELILTRIDPRVVPAFSLESKLSMPDEDDGVSEGEFILQMCL